MTCIYHLPVLTRLSGDHIWREDLAYVSGGCVPGGGRLAPPDLVRPPRPPPASVGPHPGRASRLRRLQLWRGRAGCDEQLRQSQRSGWRGQLLPQSWSAMWSDLSLNFKEVLRKKGHYFFRLWLDNSEIPLSEARAQHALSHVQPILFTMKQTQVRKQMAKVQKVHFGFGN